MPPKKYAVMCHNHRYETNWLIVVIYRYISMKRFGFKRITIEWSAKDRFSRFNKEK
jgi:hypothetical protein